MNTKKTIIIYTLAVFGFITLVIGISYAFFTANISSTGKKDTTIKAANLTLEFSENNPNLNVTALIPGESFTKSFVLENKGSITIDYKVVLKEISNNFSTKGKQDLTYTLTEKTLTRDENNNLISDDIETLITTETQFPDGSSGSSPLSTTLTIEPGVIKKYILEVFYKNDEDEPQTDDMNKTISGKLFIEEI